MDITKLKKVDKTLSIKDRIAFLSHCANLYETNGTSPISDASYDEEYYELEAIIPDDPFFDKVGGISDVHIYGTPVNHVVTMGSLNKSPDIGSFSKWILSAYPKDAKLSFVLQHKVDGTSLGCSYKDGKLVQVLSRGDGAIGIDVTENAKMVNGILHTIPFKGICEVRGECHKNRQEFYKKWHTSVGGSYKNPRNFTAGMMNLKEPKLVKEAELDFVAYEVVQKDFDTESEKGKFLDAQGFRTLSSSTKTTKFGNTLEQVVKAVKYYMEGIDRANLPYDIDGVVVKLDNVKEMKRMGYNDSGKKPKANRAVKFPPLQKETKLIDVIWQIGRTGVIKPVGVVEPTDLDGSTIQKASLHNAAALCGNSAIKLGSIVFVAKKGDIIPQIVSIKTMGNKSIVLPIECPHCKSKLEWTVNSKGENVDLFCNNYDCIAQLNKKIDYFFKTIGTKGFGKGTIDKLTDIDELVWDGKPIVSSLVEMFYMLDNDRATEHPFRKYAYLKGQLGEKTYDNLLESIRSVSEVTLPKFIEAIGIENIGSSSEDIAAIAPTIDEVDKLTLDDLLKISGFGPKKANSFIDSWKARRDEIRRLLKYIEIKENKKASTKLNGMKFCFTGSFSKSRDDLQKVVTEHSGKNCNSVSKGVILVWDGVIDGNKIDKAQKEKNQIISEDDFNKLVV